MIPVTAVILKSVFFKSGGIDLKGGNLFMGYELIYVPWSLNVGQNTVNMSLGFTVVLLILKFGCHVFTSPFLYTYIYIYRYVYVYVYICIQISIDMYMYIYMYIGYINFIYKKNTYTWTEWWFQNQRIYPYFRNFENCFDYYLEYYFLKWDYCFVIYFLF
jgi:hypothetical protein